VNGRTVLEDGQCVRYQRSAAQRYPELIAAAHAPALPRRQDYGADACFPR